MHQKQHMAPNAVDCSERWFENDDLGCRETHGGITRLETNPDTFTELDKSIREGLVDHDDVVAVIVIGSDVAIALLPEEPSDGPERHGSPS